MVTDLIPFSTRFLQLADRYQYYSLGNTSDSDDENHRASSGNILGSVCFQKEQL